MTPVGARGVTLVELLVATAIGLVVVAAAGSVVLAQQTASRRLQVEARLMQDLRAAAELVARDLRRAGHWSASAASGVRRADDAAAVNPHAAIAPASVAASAVVLSFSTADGDSDVVDDRDRFGFRLRGGAVEMQLGAAQLAGTDGHRDPRRHRFCRRAAGRRDLAGDVLRAAMRGGQHDVPAAPAGAQLRDHPRRTLGDRPAGRADVAKRRPRPQRHRRRQLRRMSAMRARRSSRAARRRCALRDRHALLRHGTGGSACAAQRARRRATFGERAALADRVRGRRLGTRVGAGAHQRSGADRRSVPAER